MGAIKELTWLVPVLLVPVLVVPSSGNAFVVPKVLVLLVSAGAATVLAHPTRTPLRRAALTFVVAYGLSTALSVSPMLSLWGSYRARGLVTIAACAVLLWAIPDDENVRRRLMDMILIGAVFVAAWAVWTWAIGGARTGTPGRVSSTMGNGLFLASYLIVPIMIALSRARVTRAYIPVAALLVGAFMLALSRGPALALAVGVATMFRGWKTLVVIGVLLVALVMVRDNSNSLRRFGFWRIAADHIAGRSLYRNIVGDGPDVFAPQVEGRELSAVHSVPLQIFIATGALGLLAWLALWWQAVRDAAQVWVFGALVAVFIESLLGVMTVSALLMFFMTLALTEGETWQTAIKS